MRFAAVAMAAFVRTTRNAMRGMLIMCEQRVAVRMPDVSHVFVVVQAPWASAILKQLVWGTEILKV